jgi:hypothetical protein
MMIDKIRHPFVQHPDPDYVDYCCAALDADADEMCGRQSGEHAAPDYPPYEQPAWQAQPLTNEQYAKLRSLCDRYRVPFDPTHYRTSSPNAVMLPGYAEGWVGGVDQADQTIYVGVAPNGDAHS